LCVVVVWLLLLLLVLMMMLCVVCCGVGVVVVDGLCVLRTGVETESSTMSWAPHFLSFELCMRPSPDTMCPC